MALPEIGTLYNPPGDAIPGTLPSVWSQPGGPGTRVFPQAYDSAAGEFEPPLIPYGMYIPGCGHPVNFLAVFREYDDESDEDAAIICCPVCTYIQRIIVPYDLFENYIETPILVA